MDPSNLRKALQLSPYESLSFGAPDKTGWAQLEVTDTLTGDFRTVGQWKAGYFRPAGPAQSTVWVGRGREPGAERSGGEWRGEAEGGCWQEQLAQLLGYVLGMPALGLLFWALLEWQYNPWKSLLMLAAVAAIVALFLLIAAHVPEPARPGHTAHTHAHSVASDGTAAQLTRLSSDDFFMKAWTCPSCGAISNDVICGFCGRARE